MFPQLDCAKLHRLHCQRHILFQRLESAVTIVPEVFPSPRGLPSQRLLEAASNCAPNHLPRAHRGSRSLTMHFQNIYLYNCSQNDIGGSVLSDRIQHQSFRMLPQDLLVLSRGWQQASCERWASHSGGFNILPHFATSEITFKMQSRALQSVPGQV
ncbi:hypothetical protein F4604DRAFT_1741184 [Suillus subluteus]|nr:hypothetical protein F4604DRAFT_1741184 [Suillus subluteus]